jgi:hypothetical protein
MTTQVRLKYFNLKHIPQKWFFIEIISTDKYKWQLVSQSLTHGAISNFPYTRSAIITNVKQAKIRQ